MHAPVAAAKSLQSCPTLCDHIDGSPPGSPALGFSRQEHWSGLPFPSPRYMHQSPAKVERRTVLKREKEVGGGAGQGKVVNKEPIGGIESLRSSGFSLAEL